MTNARELKEAIIRKLEIGETEGHALLRVKERLGIKKRSAVLRLLRKVIENGVISYANINEVYFVYKRNVFPFKIARPFDPVEEKPKRLFLRTVLTPNHVSEKKLYLKGALVGTQSMSSFAFVA